jgi:outer membrane protein OmpA-like peptidoglycan-associated protein
MKNFFAIVSLSLHIVAGIAAQEDTNEAWDNDFSVAAGAELSGFSRNGYALGAHIQADYLFLPAWAIGLRYNYATDFDKLQYNNMDVFARWYFFKLSSSLVTLNVFAQGQLGFLVFTDNINTDKHLPWEPVPGFTAGVGAGARATTKINLFLEAQARVAYPQLWGATIMLGYSFQGGKTLVRTKYVEKIVEQKLIQEASVEKKKPIEKKSGGSSVETAKSQPTAPPNPAPAKAATPPKTSPAKPAAPETKPLAPAPPATPENKAQVVATDAALETKSAKTDTSKAAQPATQAVQAAKPSATATPPKTTTPSAVIASPKTATPPASTAQPVTVLPPVIAISAIAAPEPAAKPPPKGPLASVPNLKNGEIYRIAGLDFIFTGNDTDFDRENGATAAQNNRFLDELAQFINENQKYMLTIEAHANPSQRDPGARIREEELYLRPITQERANAVLEQLVRRGVPRKRLKAVGMGGSKPLVSINDEENLWKNRRAEFSLSLMP